MQIVAWPGVCVLEVPNRWSWETSDGVISIFRPDGTGVVQVEIFPRVPARQLIVRELSLLPGSGNGEPALSDAKIGIGTGSTTTHEGDGRRWVIWAAAGAERSVKFVWFADDAPDAERGQVEMLLASFRWS